MRRRHAQGNVILVRYADDIVAGFPTAATSRSSPGSWCSTTAASSLRRSRAWRRHYHQCWLVLQTGRQPPLGQFSARHLRNGRTDRPAGRPQRRPDKPARRVAGAGPVAVLSENCSGLDKRLRSSLVASGLVGVPQKPDATLPSLYLGGRDRATGSATVHDTRPAAGWLRASLDLMTSCE